MEKTKSISKAIKPKVKELPWGVSICVDLYECNSDLISSEVHIREYVQKLCKLMDVKTYGACHVVHLGENLKVSGFSMFQLIETGSISGHFVNQSQTAYINIFSSIPFYEERVTTNAKEFFEAKKSTLQKNIRR